jgi:hypothetical protein
MDKSVKKFAESERIVSKGVTITQDDVSLFASLPRGKVFEANSKAFLFTLHTNTAHQHWLPTAINYLDGEISLGVRDATEEELAEYDHSNN